MEISNKNITFFCDFVIVLHWINKNNKWFMVKNSDDIADPWCHNRFSGQDSFQKKFLKWYTVWYIVCTSFCKIYAQTCAIKVKSVRI